MRGKFRRDLFVEGDIEFMGTLQMRVEWDATDHWAVSRVLILQRLGDTLNAFSPRLKNFVISDRIRPLCVRKE